MAFLFGGAPAKQGSGPGDRPANPFREHQRELRYGVRALEREEAKAQRADAAYKVEIMRLAREQRLDLCKAKAREMIRLRAHRSRIMTIKFHMNTLASQLTTLQSTQQLQSVMAKTTRLLQGLNRSMDPRAVHRMLCEFERQHAMMSDSQEVLQETLDSVFESENEAAETDDAMLQVFQELGLDMQGRLGGLSGPGRAPTLVDPALTDDELEARLSRLRAP
jgi:division protein CdvB (Snf7/Vps24/ESCRT-III family)